MDGVKLSNQLKQIVKIIDRWSSESVPCIERDIVLTKLQNIYQEVLFASASEIPLKTSTKVAQEVVPETHSTTVTEEVVTTIHERVICSNNDVAESCAQEKLQPKESLCSAPTKESVCETQIQNDVEPLPQIECSAQKIVEPQQNIGGANIRQPLDRNAIKSLYDDDCTTKSSAVVEETYIEEKTTTTIETVVTPMATVAPAPAPAVMANTPIAACILEPKQVPLIGDVVLDGEPTLADELGRNITLRDVATSLAQKNSTTLKGAIGINDKFLMLKEMFNGDITYYQSTIEMLEEFTDLDDALIFIHDNFNWNPNGDGVRLLIDLLNRKLS